MPLGKLGDGREKTTLVLDTFADVGNGALWVRWPVDLDEEARKLFDVLVTHLGYLGRSESWVLGESLSDDVHLPERGRAFPHAPESRPGRGYEQITLTAPDEAQEYARWRQTDVEAAIERLGIPPGAKATKAQQRKIEEIQDSYPVDLIDCLQRDTAWWRGRRWSRAPGARSILYWRETGSLEVGPPVSRKATRSGRVETMLLALTTPSGTKSALPPVARTLPQAELLHRALVSRLGFGGEPCPELVGRGEKGKPLEGHAHAHILPVDLDGDERLDHVIVFASMGLGGRAQRAVRDLRKTYMKGGAGELRLAVAGVGSLTDLRGIGAALANTVEEIIGPSSGARSWVSATPFVPPRHLKKNGRSSLGGQVEAELRVRGLPPADIEVVGWTAETRPLRHFVRRRQRGPQPPVDAGYAVRLRFERAVTGPICLGYGSHFGLGRFSAE
jgi:CRISPR-associated protein Csb2